MKKKKPKQQPLERFGIRIEGGKKEEKKVRQFTLDEISKIKQLAEEREKERNLEIGRKRNIIGKEIEKLVKEKLGITTYGVGPSPDLYGRMNEEPVYVEVKHSGGSSVCIYYDQLKRVHNKSKERNLEGKQVKTYYAFVFTGKKGKRTIYLVRTEELMKLAKGKSVKKMRWGVPEKKKAYFKDIGKTTVVTPEEGTLKRLEEIKEKIKREGMMLSKNKIKKIAERIIEV